MPMGIEGDPRPVRLEEGVDKKPPTIRGHRLVLAQNWLVQQRKLGIEPETEAGWFVERHQRRLDPNERLPSYLTKGRTEEEARREEVAYSRELLGYSDTTVNFFRDTMTTLYSNLINL